MTEWDSERPDILGRKIQANIPPAIGPVIRLPWWAALVLLLPWIIIRLIIHFR